MGEMRLMPLVCPIPASLSSAAAAVSAAEALDCADVDPAADPAAEL